MPSVSYCKAKLKKKNTSQLLPTNFCVDEESTADPQRSERKVPSPIRQRAKGGRSPTHLRQPSLTENDIDTDGFLRRAAIKARRCGARQTSPSLVALSPAPSPPTIPRRSRRHPVQTASEQTQRGGRDALKWDWRRVADCGRITGVFRQTADRGA